MAGSLAQLKTIIESGVLKATWTVTIAGVPLVAYSCSMDHGYDVASAQATVTVRAMPVGITEPRGQELIIRAGYNGIQVVRFVGEVDDVSPGFAPNTIEILAAGLVRKTQFDYPDEVTYASQTDTQIVTDLLTKAGIDEYHRDISGEGQTFGVEVDVVLSENTPPILLINDLDELTGYKTWDDPSGLVVRRELTHAPSSSAVWYFEEEVNCYGGRRHKSKSDVRNKAIVEGLPGTDGSEVKVIRQAASVYVGTPPTYRPYGIKTDLVEDVTYAATVAERLMLEHNKMLDEIEQLQVAGNPFLNPGMTVAVKGYELDLPNWGYYYVKHHHEEIGDEGYLSTLTLSGGIGDAGYQLANPIAAFTVETDLENVQVAGVDDIQYTVICDGTPSVDPDGVPGTLVYSWSNDQTADVSIEPVYSFLATAAQIAAGLNVTLTVTDTDGLTGSLTLPINETTGTALRRVMFVAAGSQAEATPDGWQTFNTWAPGGAVVVQSTPENSYEDVGLFGLSDGRLMRTADYLLSAPTELYDFGSNVNSIWIHETQAGRIAVGLDSGALYLSTDEGATFGLLYTFPAPIFCVKESPTLMGQFWVDCGTAQYLFYEGTSAPITMTDWGASAYSRWCANSFMGNFACATVPAASGLSPVRSADDGSEVAFPDMTPAAQVEDVRLITHHLYLDKLFACDTTGRFFVKGEGETAFTNTADMTSPGTVNHGLRDATLQNVVFIAADDGLYKTPDGGYSFVILRDYSGDAALKGLQVGLGTLRLKLTTGRRVWMTAYQAGAGYDTLSLCARCDNIWAATPVWVDLSTGLPGSAAFGTVTIDPADPDVGYISLGGIIYQNTDMRGTGSWAALCDDTWAATHMATIYPAAHDSVSIWGVRVATDGTLVVVITCRRTDSLRRVVGIVHSHDQGVNWTDATTAITSTNMYHSYSGVSDLLCHAQTGNPHAWLSVANSVNNRWLLFRSDDGYVTWTAVVDYEAIDLGGAYLTHDLALPSDNAFFIQFNDADANVTKHTTDGYVADKTTWVTPAVRIIQAPDSTDLAGCYTGGNLYRSTDRGQTLGSVVATFADVIYQLYAVSQDYWLCAYGAASTNRLLARATGNTLANWTSAMGTPPAGWNPYANWGTFAVDPEV